MQSSIETNRGAPHLEGPTLSKGGVTPTLRPVPQSGGAIRNGSTSRPSSDAPPSPLEATTPTEPSSTSEIVREQSDQESPTTKPSLPQGGLENGPPIQGRLRPKEVPPSSPTAASSSPMPPAKAQSDNPRRAGSASNKRPGENGSGSEAAATSSTTTATTLKTQSDSSDGSKTTNSASDKKLTPDDTSKGAPSATPTAPETSADATVLSSSPSASSGTSSAAATAEGASSSSISSSSNGGTDAKSTKTGTTSAAKSTKVETKKSGANDDAKPDLGAPLDIADFATQADQQAETAARAKASNTALVYRYDTEVRGFWVDKSKYDRWCSLMKNYSPFDAKLFYPLLVSDPIPGKILLCLDIDETLVHASTVAPTEGKKADHQFQIGEGKNSVTVYVACRPGLQEFIDFVVRRFEIAIFTASQPMYAEPLLKCIDPQGKLGRNRLFRQHCAEIDGARVKDMSLLGRPLPRVALLDNSPVAYLFQPRNAIPIVSWFDDPNDKELFRLQGLLEKLATAKEVYDVLDAYNCSQEAYNGDSHAKVMQFVENNSRNGKIGAKK